MTQPQKKDAMNNSAKLSVYWAIMILAITVIWAIYVNAQWYPWQLSSTWVDNKTEVVNKITLVDSEDQSEVVWEIYVTDIWWEQTVVIDSNSIVSQPYDARNDEWIKTNEVSGSSQILGWSGNKVYSDNITIIAWQDNVINEWNDSATMLWWVGNRIGSSTRWWVPAVMVWWVRNTIWENQYGNVIIWWKQNTIWDNVSNTMILWWENNTVSVDNTIIAWQNVNNELAENSFVFSNRNEVFSPKTPNTFYLNVSRWVWLNTEAVEWWVNSRGWVKVWRVWTMECNTWNVWIQWVYAEWWLECLVWCTQASASAWQWDLLDNSSDCIEWCKDSTNCMNPLEVEYEATPSECVWDTKIWALQATRCPYLSTWDYVNAVYTVAFVNVCPSEDEAKLVSNPCLYRCPDGTVSNDDWSACQRDCTATVDGVVTKYPSWKEIKLYKTTNETCSGWNNLCETFNTKYMIFKCEDSQWKRKTSESVDWSQASHWANVSSLWAYKYTVCTPNNNVCSSDYNLNEPKTWDGWIYTPCTWSIAAWYKCLEDVKWKLTWCESWYTFTWWKCYKDCTFNGQTVHFQESVTWYKSPTVSCNAWWEATYCESVRLTCGADGSFGKDGNAYLNATCHLTEYLRRDNKANWEAYFNLEECPKARAASWTKPSDVSEWAAIWYCESFIEYTLVNNKCKAKTWYHLTWCAAWFHTWANNLVDVCMPDCILPWQTANLKHMVANNAWSTQAIKYNSTIKWYKTASQICPTVVIWSTTIGSWAWWLSGCENKNNWAIMTCNAWWVLSWSATYVKQTCTTQWVPYPTEYNRLQPVANANCEVFQPYTRRDDNTCNVDAKRYKCTSCKPWYTINKVKSNGDMDYTDLIWWKTTAQCLKDCTFNISPSGTKTYSWYSWSPYSSGWVYNASSYTCPTAYNANTSREKWSCNNWTITRSLNLIALDWKPYLTYTQTAMRPSTLTVNDGTQTWTRTIVKDGNTAHGISNTTAVNVSSRISISPYTTYFPYYLTWTNPACTLNKTYYYLKCTPDTNTTDADKDNSWVWSTNSDKCIRCEWSISALWLRNDNKKFPTTDSITFCYSADTSTTCSFSCKDGTYWKTSTTWAYYKCGTSERWDCVDWYCDLDNGNTKKIHNTTFTIYKPSATPVCNTECETITAICKYGKWMKKNGTTVTTTEVTNAFSTCATKNGCVKDNWTPTAWTCGMTDPWVCKWNKLFTDTNYVALTSSTTPTWYTAWTASAVQHWKEYTANWKTCTLSHNYYMWSCNWSNHWESISWVYKCVNDTKSVPCTTEWKPNNSTYNSYNVNVTWTSSCTWNKAANCTWHCDPWYYKNSSNTCTKCEAWYYCPWTSSDDTRHLVSNGYYATEWSSAQTQCPAWYRDWTALANKKAESTCLRNIAWGQYMWTANWTTNSSCSAWYYKAAHSITYGQTSSCSVCDNWYYAVQWSSTQTQCPAWYRDWTAVANKTAESTCLRNIAWGQYMWTAKWTTNSTCSAWYYKAAHSITYGQTSSCALVDNWYYAVQWSSAQTQCPAWYRDGTALANKTAESVCLRSIPWWQYMATSKWTTNSTCTAWHYKAAHTITYGQTSDCNNTCTAWTFAIAWQASCSNCPSGYTSDAWATANTSCYINVACGSYKTSAWWSATAACPADTWSNSHKSYYNSSDSCATCGNWYTCKAWWCCGASAAAACKKDCPKSWWCNASIHGTTCTTSAASSVVCPATCSTVTSTCNNWTWSTTPLAVAWSCTRTESCVWLLTSCPSTCYCNECLHYDAWTCPRNGSRYSISSAKAWYYINWNTCSACTTIANSYSWTSAWSSATTCGFTCNAWYKYNWTNRTCTACDNGTYTTAGNTSTSCSACTAITNRYSWTSRGTSATTCGFTCNAWYKYNWTNRTCTACDNGTYTTAGNTSTSCSACTGMPASNAHWTSNGTSQTSCTWECNDGYHKEWSTCVANSCAASGWCPKTDNGWTCTTYANNAPTWSACSATTSTCNNWTWSTTPKSYWSCTAYCAASWACSKSAAWTTCYSYNRCSSSKITSTCQSNWTWSTTPWAYSSSYAGCNSCSWCPTGTVAHWGKCTTYNYQSVACWSSCSTKTSTCSDWSRSPSLWYSNCTVWSCCYTCADYWLASSPSWTCYSRSSKSDNCGGTLTCYTNWCDAIWYNWYTCSSSASYSCPSGTMLTDIKWTNWGYCIQCTVACQPTWPCWLTPAWWTCDTYSVKESNSCSSFLNRITCQSNWTWNKSPSIYWGCTTPPKKCPASWACSETSDGGTCTTYSSSSVTCPSSCTSRTSTCNNGTWSSTPYSNSSCSRAGTCSYSLTSCPDNWTCSRQSCYLASSCSSVTRYRLDSCNTNYTMNNAGTACVASCFPAGTKVYMEDGSLKNIEEIQTGDVVLTYNEDTQAFESNEILSPIVHPDSTDEMYELTIDGDILKVTYAHRFYVVVYEDKEDGLQCGISYKWIAAQDLKVWDLLFMNNGKYAEIDAISHYPNVETVYNLSVANNHNYFVDKWYLVHNRKIDNPIIDSCFVAWTKVVMADGTEKNIEDVKIWEKILWTNWTVNTVLWYDRPVLWGRHLWSINGWEYFVSDEHPFKTTEWWKSFNPEMTKLEIDLNTTELKVWDVLVTADWEEEVKTVDYIDADYNTPLYNFVLDWDHTYYANNYLVHNKSLCSCNAACPECYETLQSCQTANNQNGWLGCSAQNVWGWASCDSIRCYCYKQSKTTATHCMFETD